MATIEIELKTSLVAITDPIPVDIGGGVLVNAETYNGSIPGPTIELQKDDTLIVRLINDLPHETGIHWHGIELQNSADGTPVTQDGVPGAPLQVLGNGVPAGGTYLYKFKAPRPGIFWYHPHHHHSTNRVFRGLYGLIIVIDPNEATLIGNGIIPGAANTERLVLSDITRCKMVGANDTPTYEDPTTLPAADRPEWLSGATAQLGPSPMDLCELSPMNEDGTPGPAFGDGDVPNIQRSGPGRTVEGQIVLTNGANVGGRLGTPDNPGALEAGAQTINVSPGQGLRLQIVNCAHLRYFRLRLKSNNDTPTPLVRIGGEGGLLNNAILEGGTQDTLDTRYESGEILIPPASRADIVAAIPSSATGVLTLWTRDFPRTGPVNPGNWAQLPTVPVLHLNVTGAAIVPAYTISDGTALLSSIPGAELAPLGTPTATLLDPSTFATPKQGMSNPDIQLTAGGGVGINGIPGSFGGFTPYTNAPHLGSSRYGKDGDILELMVTNASSAHHPFHLHGFSFQPVSLEPRAGAPSGVTGTFTWPVANPEFRDNLNIPSQYSLTFRVHISDRELADGTTFGGALGRWLFHCHIFFHAHQGMIGELVISDADGSGNEKPYIDVGGSWAYAPTGGMAERFGTFTHHDGKVVTLTASEGTINFPPGVSSGNWSWTLMTDPGGADDGIRYVYITAEDSDGRKDQAVFRLQIGGLDQGSDNGDPHIHTVGGNRYDFQAVGEFTLLRDRQGMEIQARQTPVLTANPITDPYSGLKACVSLNTAVAARVGLHRIAYQPIGEQGELQFYLDGKPTRLTTEGIDLDGNHVSGFDVNGQMVLRIDYAHHPVLTVTPLFWNSHGLWYMNVNVSHTNATEGIMGPISKGSWLPKLRSGADLGPMPESLNDRYVDLYKTFADSWRVTDQSSLFVYESGTSTTTFTDKDWPAQEPPCVLKPQFEILGAPLPAGTDIANATLICQGVTDGGLIQDCIFDVATTGDAEFAQGYLILQDLRLNGTKVQIISDKKSIIQGESVNVTALVLPMRNGRPTPKGKVTFQIDGSPFAPSIDLDEHGHTTKSLTGLSIGEHKIRATYDSLGGDSYRPSGSPSVIVVVEKGPVKPKKPWYWWVILLIILLILLSLIIFS